MTGQSPATPMLLFVCTGNICRSPMAHAIANDVARSSGVDVRVESAGVAALSGHGIHESARIALEALGLDFSTHRARQITREQVGRASLVITATKRQRDDLRHFFPREQQKILSFDDATGLGELDDPLGGGADAFARTAELLRAGMPVILQVLQHRRDPDTGA